VNKQYTVAVHLPDRSFRLLFIVVLLVSQFSLLEHQLDIQHHANGKVCTICLASPGLDHALSDIFLPPPLRAVVEAPVVFTEYRTGSLAPVRQVARAPPVSSLHA
jgi:hypothetical protein